MRFTKEELPGVSETLGNTDSCITTSVSIRAVVKSVFKIVRYLLSRRFKLMLTQCLKMSMISSLSATGRVEFSTKKLIQSFVLCEIVFVHSF